MRKKQITLSIILVLLMIILPLILFLSASAMIPNQYDNTIYKELGIKYDLLKNVEGERIILIGGSSVSFGYDSQIISEYLERPVINFGLYASLGTKIMLDLAEKQIRKGDLVILMPELSEQTYSLYFGGDAFLKCIESHREFAVDVKYNNMSDLLASYPKYLAQKNMFFRKGLTPNPQDVYNAKNFNKYGDVQFERKYNIMANMYDSNNMVSITEDLINDEFIEYVNDFYKRIKGKGANLYYSYSPVNNFGLSDDTTNETIVLFNKKMMEALDCQIISDINECIMNEKYFYDTNFHLNNAGVRLKTKMLIEDILREEKNNRVVDIELFEPDDIPKENTPNDDLGQYADMFITTNIGDGVSIKGVQAKYIDEEVLVVPTAINGLPVQKIESKAFSNCSKLRKLIISEGKLSISDNIVQGCKQLRRIELMEPVPSNVSFGMDMLAGTSNCSIYIKKECFANYLADYHWVNMDRYLVALD